MSFTDLSDETIQELKDRFNTLIVEIANSTNVSAQTIKTIGTIRQALNEESDRRKGKKTNISSYQD